jgi:two-component system, chemotaxis family, protein-glutamate methylesterase/glutaminase
MTLSSAPAPRSSAAIRVLITDDSAVVRGLIQRWLSVEAGIEIVGVAINGVDGVRLAGELKPDVMVLDVEMPQLDGIGAIPQILKLAPQTKILMASTLTQRNADITLQALGLGAADYVPKPETGKIAAAADFKRDLIARIRGLGAARLRTTSAPQRPALPVANTAPIAPPARPATPGQLKPAPSKPAEIVVIGASTGGPQALNKVIAAIGGKLNVPILIVQHMPAMFTRIMAEHLSKLSPATVVEAKDGQPLRPGQILVAPGDFHMRVVRKHGAPVIALDQGPQINFCRPAVDPLFTSVAQEYGSSVFGAVLTGMGADGRKGAEAIVARGGAVMAQDEATSVVWGMPGAVVGAGLACAIKSIDEFGPALVAFAQGKRP